MADASRGTVTAGPDLGWNHNGTPAPDLGVNPASPVNVSENRPLPIIVVGAGLAGTTAAAVLARQGWRVTLVDPKPSCPRVFKAEKIEPGQADQLRKFGLLDCLLTRATRIQEIQSYYNGRCFRVTPTEQYGIHYSDMVDVLRSHLPATVEFKLGRVVQIANNAELPRVRLAGGEELTASLVVLACPLSPEIRTGLRLKKVLIQKNQSLAIGFTITRSNGRPFSFHAVTYYPTTSVSAVDYLNLFPIGDSIRANLFTFHAAGDGWVREFIREPTEGLHRCLPKLRNAIGEYRVTSKVEIGHVDLYRLEGDFLPGVVRIGDASQNVCPSTAMGVSKVLTDVDVLCSECIPRWFASAGMGSDKLTSFFNHPRKLATDVKALRNASYRRRACLDRSFRWRLHRLRLHLSMQFKSPSPPKASG